MNKAAVKQIKASKQVLRTSSYLLGIVIIRGDSSEITKRNHDLQYY